MLILFVDVANITHKAQFSMKGQVCLQEVQAQDSLDRELNRPSLK